MKTNNFYCGEKIICDFKTYHIRLAYDEGIKDVATVGGCRTSVL